MESTQRNMVQILCGPVVGHVTTTTARILLEFDESIDLLSCSLREHKNPSNIAVTQADVQSQRPQVFQFDSLKADTEYDILVTAITPDILGRFCTLPDDLNKMNIVVVSCDKRRYQNNGCNMWKKLANRILDPEKDVIHILLHIGDNVYIDGEASDDVSTSRLIHDSKCLFNPKRNDQSVPYIVARKALHGLPYCEWDSLKDDILEIYRREYRATFTRPYVQSVLSHVSNLMILDDHDIRDDFGLMEEDSDPKSVEFFLGNLAVQVYHEYQRALWDPAATMAGPEAFKNEFYCLTFGPVGVIMLDSRTSNSINICRRSEGDKSYYGRAQMDSLVGSLHGHPKVRVWCISSTLPLIFLNRKVSRKIVSAVSKADDFVSHINYNHIEELEEILEHLKCWKSGGPDREILILSGDVHVAGFTDIKTKSPSKDGNQLLCRQITTSPIHNESAGSAMFLALKAAFHISEKAKNFSFKHYGWLALCNYAEICFEFDKLRGPVHYVVKIVYEEGEIVKSSSETDWDTGGGPVSCVCDIL